MRKVSKMDRVRAQFLATGVVVVGLLCGMMPPLVAQAAVSQTVQCEIPNILILLDISGSMLKGTPKKYTEAIAGIDLALQQFEGRAKFGLMVFPRPNEGATVYGYCTTSAAMAVPFATNNRQAIKDYLSPTGANYFGGPKGSYDTPLYQGLSSAAALPGFIAGQKNIIMLISDGSQDCCRKQDFNNTADCIPNTVILESNEAEANRLAIVGLTSMMTSNAIGLYAVGFSSDSDASLLNRLADAAGTGRAPGCDATGTVPGAADSCYYPANDAQSLANALATVVQTVGQEVCDGVDNDCDGKIDNVPGSGERLTRACTAQCGSGLQECITPPGGNYEKWSACDVPPPEKEVCDGVDNDCDGEVDEGLSLDCSNCRGEGSLDCVSGKMTECSAPVVLSITDCSDPVAPLDQPIEDIGDVNKRKGTIIDGCGCGASSSSASGYLVIAAVLFVLARRRRRA